MCPLDGTESLYVTTDPDAEVRPDLSKPTPEALIWVLEHWAESPVSHLTFSFRYAKPIARCGTAGCAYGTAEFLWGDDWTLATSPLAMKGREIFREGQFDPRITAVVVAGRMRDALAGRPIRYLVENDRG